MTTTPPTDTPRLPTAAPRLPAFEPRKPGEPAETYGLRSLIYIAAARQTAAVDAEGLALAAESLAGVIRLIGGDLIGRREDAAALAAIVAATLAAPETVPAPAGAAIVPPAASGPVAAPAPVLRAPTPPSAARPARPAVTGPAAIPARYTAISPALAGRLAPVTAAPLAAEELF